MAPAVTHRSNQPSAAIGPSHVVPPPRGVHPPWHPALAGAASAIPPAAKAPIDSARSVFISSPLTSQYRSLLSVLSPLAKARHAARNRIAVGWPPPASAHAHHLRVMAMLCPCDRIGIRNFLTLNSAKCPGWTRVTGSLGRLDDGSDGLTWANIDDRARIQALFVTRVRYTCNHGSAAAPGMGRRKAGDLRWTYLRLRRFSHARPR